MKNTIYIFLFMVSFSFGQSVGINTTNPIAKLDVNGDVRVSGTATNAESTKILVRGENNIISQSVMPNFFGISGLVIPVCGANGVNSVGNFSVTVNAVQYNVNWKILKKFVGTQSYPLQGQRLQVRYNFNPPLPFQPDGFSLTPYNNSNHPDTFAISYDSNYTDSSITVNISRTDITSTDEHGSCWGGQFYFDMLIYRYNSN